MLVGLGLLLILTLARLLFRSTRAAVAAEATILLVIQALASHGPFWMRLPLALLIVTLLNAVLLRFGLLSAVITLVTANLVLSCPLTADLGAWNATPTLLSLSALGALLLWGWRSARLGGPAHRPPASPPA
jgi:hypothetical protein